MKTAFSILLFCLVFISCNQQNGNTQKLQLQVDSLQQKLEDAYKPGLGEFMSGIQVHHEKLWFAGQAQNWKLADFEIHEIMEAIDDIKNYASDRPEVKSISMIQPPIDSINNAIQQKNLKLFKQSFTLLTNTCNNCHRATQHEFNVIVIPTTPPFSNQDFNAAK